ncbi:hypothetical protein BC940DRAFT_334944 [Gongronella butleri]|nr:hypothetical protein BC940DRAFT_334944 [Gongronella butleri]
MLTRQRQYIYKALVRSRSTPTASALYTSVRSYSDDHRRQGNEEEDAAQAPYQQQQQQTSSSSSSSSPSSAKPGVAVTPIAFMPVINIPQTEFLYNAFFSLNRPLLGLQDDSEKPFFASATHTEDDDPDEDLNTYLSALQHFEPPLTPEEQRQQEAVETAKQQDGHDDVFGSISGTSTTATVSMQEEFYMEQTLPMYYMPDSDEIVDYLTTVQQKILLQQDRATVGRQRRSKLVPLSAAPLTCRYQRRPDLGVFRHRWSR